VPKTPYELDVFVDVNKFIEKEADKKSYDNIPDIDTTSIDLLELIVHFSFLVTFGIGYALCFGLVFGLNLLKLLIGKKIFIEFTQRPTP
jgi:hypothetical protein